MKKIFLFLILFTLFFNINVYAQTSTTCDKDTKNNLKVIANQVDYEIELNAYVKEYSDIEKLPAGALTTSYYYLLTVSNISEEIYVKVGQNTKFYNSAKDGKIVFNDTFLNGGDKVKLYVYGTTRTGCGGVQLRVISIKIPYYNAYSVYPECEGNQEKYKICSRTTNVSGIESEADFKAELEKEKKAYEEKNSDTKDDTESKKGLIQTIKDWYMENKNYTIPATVALLLLIILFFVKAKRDSKNKVKINLGDI